MSSKAQPKYQKARQQWDQPKRKANVVKHIPHKTSKPSFSLITIIPTTENNKNRVRKLTHDSDSPLLVNPTIRFEILLQIP